MIRRRCQHDGLMASHSKHTHHDLNKQEHNSHHALTTQQPFLSAVLERSSSSHNPHLPCFATDLIQLSLGLLLHPTDVLHSQINPLIKPAKELPVEVCEEPLFLLQKEE